MPAPAVSVPRDPRRGVLRTLVEGWLPKLREELAAEYLGPGRSRCTPQHYGCHSFCGDFQRTTHVISHLGVAILDESALSWAIYLLRGKYLSQ